MNTLIDNVFIIDKVLFRKRKWICSFNAFFQFDLWNINNDDKKLVKMVITQQWLTWHGYLNKSDGKRRNTLCSPDLYTRNVLRLWNSRDRETV